MLLLIGDQEIEALEFELRDSLTMRVTHPISADWLEQVLIATEHFCTDWHYHRFTYPRQFMKDFETLKWHLWTAMDRDELSPAELARRESQRDWFREYARSLPDPSDGKIGEWKVRDGSIVEMTTIDFK